MPAEALQALRHIYTEQEIVLGIDADYYGHDESHAIDPQFLAVVFPKTHEQVVETVRWANHHRIALVPSGGRTGLSGGACAGNNELVISFEKMRRVLYMDEMSGQITIEAGVTIEYLQNYASELGWFYPVDYASKGSAQIGGAVATNAGGIRVLRYGMTRNWIVGLKAVMGTGDTLDINRHLTKDNAGYDVKQLIIGSEGTLALVTEVTVQLTKPMLEQETVLMGFHTLEDMIVLFADINKYINLNAAEFFCENALSYVSHQHRMPLPLSKTYAFYLLLEFDKDERNLSSLTACTREIEVILSTSMAQTKQLWSYRELISSTINPMSPYKNDVACVLQKLSHWLLDLESEFNKLGKDVTFVWFGHLGDGNVHVNVIPNKNVSNAEFMVRVEQYKKMVGTITQRYNSTASAEHGIGLLKNDLLDSTRTVQEIVIYHAIKKIFDPNGTLNPNKLLRCDR